MVRSGPGRDTSEAVRRHHPTSGRHMRVSISSILSLLVTTILVAGCATGGGPYEITLMPAPEVYDDGNIDLDDLCKKLKRQLACGGTAKGKRIEIQGDHAEKVKKLLVSLNYPEDQIEIV